mmetsp:Transcript_68399/g.150380  ORF Transcript_68399/g.150380 Transcript_68399/m.150380 type:complete len:305 (+) Transcript_68399:978-1892(+)
MAKLENLFVEKAMIRIQVKSLEDQLQLFALGRDHADQRQTRDVATHGETGHRHTALPVLPALPVFPTGLTQAVAEFHHVLKNPQHVNHLVVLENAVGLWIQQCLHQRRLRDHHVFSRTAFPQQELPKVANEAGSEFSLETVHSLFFLSFIHFSQSPDESADVRTDSGLLSIPSFQDKAHRMDRPLHQQSFEGVHGHFSMASTDLPEDVSASTLVKRKVDHPENFAELDEGNGMFTSNCHVQAAEALEEANLDLLPEVHHRFRCSVRGQFQMFAPFLAHAYLLLSLQLGRLRSLHLEESLLPLVL